MLLRKMWSTGCCGCLIGILPFLIICLVFLGVVIYIDHQREREIENYLLQKVGRNAKDSLCGRGLVPPNLGDCSDKNLVILRRDIPIVLEHNLTEKSTYDDVSKMFGFFERQCDKEQEGSLSCAYDIGGYFVFIEFSDDTKLITSISSDMFSYR